jgi:uncharacterized protein (DUF1330 family)
MSALLVVHLNIKNTDKLTQYNQQAAKTLSEFNATIKTKGRLDHIFHGEHNFQSIALIEFPDLESIKNWYQSTGYQSLIPIRNEAAEMVFTSYQLA